MIPLLKSWTKGRIQELKDVFLNGSHHGAHRKWEENLTTERNTIILNNTNKGKYNFSRLSSQSLASSSFHLLRGLFLSWPHRAFDCSPLLWHLLLHQYHAYIHFSVCMLLCAHSTSMLNHNVFEWRHFKGNSTQCQQYNSVHHSTEVRTLCIAAAKSSLLMCRL